jgi:acyl-CoA synthetase (AMP-forming)/AMP-acid ligase II
MYPGKYTGLTPDRPAVVMADTGETLSYAQLEERSVRVSRLLHDRGLRRGDTFALLAENSLRYYETCWAALRSGLYLTAINHHLKPAEIAYIVNDCGAKLLIASAAKAEQATAIVEETPAVATRIAFGGAIDRHEDYDTLLAVAGTEPLPDSRSAATCSTRRARPGGRRRSRCRCPSGGSTSPATPSYRSSARCTGSTPTPSTCARRRCTTPHRCASGASCTRWVAPG